MHDEIGSIRGQGFKSITSFVAVKVGALVMDAHIEYFPHSTEAVLVLIFSDGHKYLN